MEALDADDRIRVATCAEHSIDTIVSADASFDRFTDLRRIDPLDEAALCSLLA